MTPDPLAELVEIIARAAVAEYLAELSDRDAEPPTEKPDDRGREG